MTDEITPESTIFHAISSLRGWDESLAEAHSYGSAYAWRIGRVLSAVLLAGGDDRAPVAISGILDENGTGHLAVVYDNLLVYVAALELTAQTGDVTVTVHGFDELEGLKIRTEHNYFDGTNGRPRHKGLEVEFELRGAKVTLSGRPHAQHPLAQPAAVFEAFKIIRDARTSRR